MAQENSAVKYSLVIHLAYVRGMRDISASYSFFRNMKCPLGKDTCTYRGGAATLCSCGHSKGIKKICVCKSAPITEDDIKGFTDNIRNIIGGVVVNQILSDVHQK